MDKRHKKPIKIEKIIKRNIIVSHHEENEHSDYSNV